jgi:two-component system CheB/CheR fusion protein
MGPGRCFRKLPYARFRADGKTGQCFHIKLRGTERSIERTRKACGSTWDGSEVGVSQDGNGSLRRNGDHEPAASQRDLAPDLGSEDGAHALLHALPAAVYTTDAAGHITFYNEAAAALWGCRPTLNTDQWCGSWRMYWPDGTPLPHAECPMAIAVRENRSFAGNGQEAVAERPDGTRVPFMAFPSVLHDSTGAVVGAVNIFMDISERKRAETTLRENEERFRALVEASAQIVWTTDADGAVIEDSPSWRAFTGQTFDAWKGHGWTAALHPEDRDGTVEMWRRAVAEGTPVDSEYRVRHVSGDYRWLSVRAVPLRNSDGRLRGWVGMNCDITERKRAEEQIVILAREAEHRTKNVLSTVQATVELTQADTPDGFKHAIKGRIQALANAHRLFVQSSWAGADLRDLVTQELSPYCQDGETRARIDGANVMLEPNTAQTIAMCVHELATNAAKYGALSLPEGRVQIEWSRTADGRFVLRWTETNGPPARQPTRRGFGMRVMEGMIRAHLNGELRFDWRPEGLSCEIALTT